MPNQIPSPDVVFDFSDTTLQDLLMASLDRRSRHIKAGRISLEEAAKEEAIALLAEYVLKYREEIWEMVRVTLEGEKLPERKTA